jgi:hypothetical protein
MLQRGLLSSENGSEMTTATRCCEHEYFHRHFKRSELTPQHQDFRLLVTPKNKCLIEHKWPPSTFVERFSWPEFRIPETFRYRRIWTRAHGGLVSVVTDKVCLLLTAVQTGTRVHDSGKVPHSQLLIMLYLIFHIGRPRHVVNPGVGIVMKHFPKHIPQVWPEEFYSPGEGIVYPMTKYLDSQTLPTCEFINQRNQRTLMRVFGHHNVTHPQ